MRKLSFFILFILSQLIVTAYAETTLLLNPGQKNLNIDARLIEVIEDIKGTLKIEDMAKTEVLKRFKKRDKKVLSFGFTTASIWIKLPVQNKSSIKKWVLNVNFPDLDELIFYKKNKEGRWIESRGGDILSTSQWEFKYKDYVFSLGEEETSTYFLKVRSRGAMTIPLQMMTKDKFFKLRGTGRLFFGGYFSILIFMMIYNIIIAFFLKSKPFFFYVGYLGSMAWMTSVLSGMGRSVLIPDNIWFSNEGFVFSLLFFFFFFLLFTKEFIGVEKKYIKLNKFYVLSCYCIGVFLFIAPFVSLSFNLNLIVGSAVPAMGTAVFTGFYFFKEKREARFYIYSFLLVILGGITKALSALGVAPSSFVIENGIFLGFLIQVALLSLGLADVINTLLKKTIEAEGKLVEANKSLEDKVRERTFDLSAALDDISNLLHNMRQAVFTADKGGVILSPVSIFSENIFKGKIEGKSLNDTIYKDMDKTSEAFSTLQFSFGIIFGADDLQWEMVKDHFPNRIIYKQDDHGEKILKVAYTPLLDKDGLLERVMFVVEDITEIELLEKEMEEQKMVSFKSNQILQELALNKKEDLHLFFFNTNQMCLDVLSLAKKMRFQVEVEQELSDMDIFCRHLHTIKGNARVFNLNYISSVAHQLETKLLVVMEKVDKKEKPTWDEIDGLVQGIYELQGQVNEYLKVAKNVFSIELEEDIKFKDKLHVQIKHLENWMNQLMLVGSFDENQGNSENINSFLKKFIDKTAFQEKVIDELKNISHSFKGLARGMDEIELSEGIHRFEGGLSILENSEERTEENFTELFIGPLNVIKGLSLDIYLSSKKIKIYDPVPGQWFVIFVELFEVGSMFKKENNENELTKKIDAIHEKANSLGLEYIGGLVGTLHAMMKEKMVNNNNINHILKKSWEYLILFCTLDNNNIYSDKERTEIKEKLIEKRSIDEFSFLKEESVFVHFIKKMEEKGHSYSNVLDEVSKILMLTYDQVISHLVIEQDLTKVVSEMFYELKKGFNLEKLNSLEGYFKGKEDFFHKFKHWFFEREGFSETNYLRNVDIIKILNTFCFHSDVIEEVKPKTYDVLVENYNQCFEAFSKIVEQNKTIDLDTLNKTFEKLLYVPIKQSFYKFNSIVKVISKSLGKKINFRVVGEDGGLERERLNLLQDVMVHLVRNSVDHGIEVPSQRILKGKEEIGTIEIGCSQVSDKTFQVSIKDDGGGIDIKRVVQKVLEKELFGEEELKNMNEKEKLDLIFLPNFSTKEDVSEISGRGVGMDVVKKNLDNIGAYFEVKTIKDYGTEFIISLDIEKK